MFNTPRKHRPDYLLLLAISVLLLVGVVVIYSISPVLSHKLWEDAGRNYFLYEQLGHLSVALIGFALASNFNYHRWPKLLPALVVGSGFSLLLLMIPGLGASKNGATRWVEIADFSFQPSEMLKLTLVVLLATKFANMRPQEIGESRRMLWPVGGLLGIMAVFVLFLQRDLGTMLVITTVIVGLFCVSGVAMRQLWTLVGLCSGLGVTSIILFPHRIARVMTFLNPDHNISGSGYHLNQALIAIGSGGLLGIGLGKSVQVYGYLPEAANDSIFAIIAETFGLVGCVFLLGLFVFLLYRSFMVVQQAPDRLAQLLAFGVMLWIGSQTLINMSAMLGLIPLTGIPLPFVSFGGTSLVFSLIGMGIVVNISKYRERGTYARDRQRRRDRRPYYAGNRYHNRPQESS